MSEVPAGWYDDPEDPSQYRYWDGTKWSDYRSPRGSIGSRRAGGSLGGKALADGATLLRRNWGTAAAVALISFVVALVGVVVILFAADGVFDPPLDEIIDRVTEPGFNTQLDPDDDAFVDSIEFEGTASFWWTVTIAPTVMLAAFAFLQGTLAVHLAADHVGRPLSPAQSLGIAIRRLPRWLGVFVLWTLAYAGIIFIVALAAAASAALALLVVVVGIGVFIWLYPTLWLLTIALAVGPTTDPPFRTVLSMMRSRDWTRIAGPVLIVNLVAGALYTATNSLALVPPVGPFLSLIAIGATYAYITAVNLSLWTGLGGHIGVDIGGGAAPVR